jgi:hypothetical protein
VAEDGDGRGEREIVGGDEASADHRWCTDDGEEVVADGRGAGALRPIGSHERAFAPVVHGDVGQRLRVPAEEKVAGLGHSPSRVRVHAGNRVIDVHQSVRVRVRQRPQDDGVEQRVDRGGRADT